MFQKYAAYALLPLLAIALYVLSYDISRPLIDYDEASYAKVTVETLRSDSFMTLRWNDRPWMEKPPLYFWLSMTSASVLGEHEYSYRLPAILLALLAMWLTYALVKALTEDEWVALFSLFILMTSEPFLIFAREARTDQGMVAGILAALLFCVKGWKDERYLLGVFPAIALGFMSKIVAFLAVPVILVYCALYQQWRWLTSKYLWLGLIPAAITLLPWHIYESVQFGRAFWDALLWQQIFVRGTTMMTGTNNPFDYIAFLLNYYRPWMFVLMLEAALMVVLLPLFFLKKRISFYDIKSIAAPFLAAVFIIFVFTLAHTHLPSYILPALPFLAMGIAISLTFFVRRISNRIVRIVTAVFLGTFICFYARISVSESLHQVPAVTYEEKAVGVLHGASAPGGLYSFDWQVLETVNYYAATSTTLVESSSASGIALRAPFYLIVPMEKISLFYAGPNAPRFPGLSIMYQGQRLMLLRGNENLSIPQ